MPTLAPYCDMHDWYFKTREERQQHLNEFEDHPKCLECRVSFLNNDRLRNHLIHAEKHWFCVRCNLMFRTHMALRLHSEELHPGDDLYTIDFDTPPKGSVQWAPGNEYDTYGRYVDEDDDELLPKNYPAELIDDDFDLYMYGDLEDVLPPPTTPSPEHELENPFESDEDEDEEEDPGFVCPCCHEETEAIGCTPCGHVCCLSCLKAFHDRWSSCPVCNEELSLDHIRKIYLTAI